MRMYVYPFTIGCTKGMERKDVKEVYENKEMKYRKEIEMKFFK